MTDELSHRLMGLIEVYEASKPWGAIRNNWFWNHPPEDWRLLWPLLTPQTQRDISRQALECNLRAFQP